MSYINALGAVAITNPLLRASKLSLASPSMLSFIRINADFTHGSFRQ